jgi:nitroreductase
MDVFEAVRTLLAIREYDDRPVPRDVVRRIVEAGRLTASSQNGQPWHFVVVEDRALLERLGAELRTGHYVSQAPLAVAVAVHHENRFRVSDGSRAIQSMMLTAWAAGVGSNWVGFIGGLEDVKPLLGVPGGYDLLAVVPFGYPRQQAGKGEKKRKPLAEVASSNRFGNPFE